ncbi:MAG: helix-turn-helix transcriptional regulator [Gammaproteobacteria bacterium]|nr:helix-turn-helix transcriptional regulator [Gammaproteobacteria bacterium]NIR96850.1 helix-turn-helix transcriptional regulator [Gammaproteobacteria bacterium]NIV19505.1 helix-turn-helix domain-containing protein [Gammaproteobacteria bacterium]
MRPRRRGVPYRSVREELLRKPQVKQAYDEYAAALAAARLVREMRTHAELTQAQLASRMNMSASVIGRLERGRGRRGPTMEMLLRIATACNYSLHLLAKRTNHPGELDTKVVD